MEQKKHRYRSLRNQRFSVSRARKKSNGRLIFRARPKALLSARNESGGPQTRDSPPVRMPKIVPFTASRPRLKPVTRKTFLKRSFELITRIITKVISKILLIWLISYLALTR